MRRGDEALPDATLLSVNVPAGPIARLPADLPRPARLSRSGRGAPGPARPRVLLDRRPRGDATDVPGSDCRAVRDGLVSVTPLGLDLTHTRAPRRAREWQVGKFVHDAVERAKKLAHGRAAGSGDGEAREFVEARRRDGDRAARARGIRDPRVLRRWARCRATVRRRRCATGLRRHARCRSASGRPSRSRTWWRARPSWPSLARRSRARGGRRLRLPDGGARASLRGGLRRRDRPGARGPRARRWRALGLRNVEVARRSTARRLGEHAPYDVIIVSAGAPRVPPLLVDQLADGGRLVIPVGPPQEQTLALVRRHGDQYETTYDTRCRYVDLLGRFGVGGGRRPLSVTARPASTRLYCAT